MARRIVERLEAFKDRLEGSPRKQAEQERKRVFGHYVQAAVQDGVLTNDEITYLRQIGNQLGLDHATVERVLFDEVVEFFRATMRGSDYRAPADAVALLRTIQADLKNLRAKWSEVRTRLRGEILDYLGRVLDRQWDDHFLSPEEIDAFKAICTKFGIGFDVVARHFAKRIHSELEGYLNIQYYSGELSAGALGYVHVVASAFELEAAAKARLTGLGERLLLLSRVRRGDLPTYDCPLMLDSGERCVYSATGARFLPAATTRVSKPLFGTFVVSDRTIYFEPFDGGVRKLRLKGITSLEHDGRGIVVRGSKKSASGTYFVGEDDLASEILYAAIQIEKRHMLPNEGAQRTRAIPQSVRHYVYQRDGGRCVQCGSVQNIHFDHIIPFSRGGAHSIENIQLLCAACNLAKGDRV